MRQVALNLATKVGVTTACQVLGVPRSSLYRDRAPRQSQPRPKPSPSRALSVQEREQVKDVLNSDRFQDASPRQVWAQLLDEGTYLCSWRTMYRVLAEHDQVRERRNRLQHPVYHKPELLACNPNEV